VLPSLNEGISNTILEAMACARAVVASRVGGNAELVQDGWTGTLYPAGDLDALAAVLADYLRQPELAAIQGSRAREVVQTRFALNAMVRRYAELYTHVLTS